MATNISSKPEYGAEIAVTEKGEKAQASNALQIFLDDLEIKINQLLSGNAGANPGGSSLTATEIAALYEGLTDRNRFSNNLLTRLTGIQAGAQVNPSDAEIRTASGFTQTLEDKLDGLETGWGFYKDATAGQAVIANTDLQVTIDGLSASTDTSNWPLTGFWNTVSNEIEVTEDSAHIFSFTFTFTPSDGTASYIDVWLDIGIGFRLFNDKHDVLGGSGVAHTAYQVIPAFVSSSFATNGGAIMVRSDGPGTISDTSIAAIVGHIS